MIPRAGLVVLLAALLEHTPPVSADFSKGISIQPQSGSSNLFDIRWTSEASKLYEVWDGATVTQFNPTATGLVATQPTNVWWIDATGASRRFFRVRELGGAAPLNLLVNGDFATGSVSPWITSIIAPAAATLAVTSGELVVDISNGGTAASHVALIQRGFGTENGQFYTLKFDARSVGEPRTIQARVQSTNAPASNTYFVNRAVALTTNMQTFAYTYQMTNATDPGSRVSFNLGLSTVGVVFDNVSLTAGIARRLAAHDMVRRMAGGNNWMASDSMFKRGAREDYLLLNRSGFSHCRIGYKMDERTGAAPAYLIPAADLTELKRMVDLCLGEGLIAMVDPIHNWSNGPGYTHPDDLPKLTAIWQQVAAFFASYPKDMVVFEIMNEPHSDDNVAAILAAGLGAIRNAAGNEDRLVIVSGQGFSTRQALIGALNNDTIPANDPYLIGTFHYYDPRPFTKQGETNGPSIYWGTNSADFTTVASDFDAVVAANTAWGARNGTEPLPIYLGEFGVDNAAPAEDRKRWLSWIRLQAEARGFAWAHWTMYNDAPSAKGMGPWTSTQINNPSTRTFQTNAVEALMTRYEAEQGSRQGGVLVATSQPGFVGAGYVAYPVATGSGVYLEINGYIPRTDAYKVNIRYASDVNRTLKLVSLNNSGSVVQSQPVTFPATGGWNNWATLSVNLNFEAGEEARVRLIADTEQGPLVDYLFIRL